MIASSHLGHPSKWLAFSQSKVYCQLLYNGGLEPAIRHFAILLPASATAPGSAPLIPANRTTSAKKFSANSSYGGGPREHLHASAFPAAFHEKCVLTNQIRRGSFEIT